MQRTKHTKADAILCSDIHLREDTPTCYVGNFQQEQWDGLDFVSELQKNHDCIVLHAGDLFHHWKPSPWLLSKAMIHLPENFHTIYGQHDLPQHNLEMSFKSGIATLENAGKVKVLPGCSWGMEVENESINITGLRILVWHHLTYQQKPFPGAEGGMANGILRKWPIFDLILTGDNHTPFVETYKHRLLVNPGSFTRQTAAQQNHKPRVYLWYAVTNTVVPVYLPIDEKAISRAHIEKVEERDARIDAFVSQLNDDWEASMSFEENLKQFQTTNKVKDSVMQIIYKSIGL